MAIAKMSKLRLVGFLEDKDDILNEMARLGKSEIAECQKFTNTSGFENGEEIINIEKVLNKTEQVVFSLEEICEDKTKSECFYKDFLLQEKKYDENLLIVDELAKYLDEILQNYGLIKKCKKEKIQMVPNEIKKLLPLSKPKKSAKFSKNDEKVKSVLDKIQHLLPKEEVEEQIEDIKFLENEELSLVFKVDKTTYENMKDEIAKMDYLQVTEQQGGVFELYFSFKYLGEEMQAVYENKIRELDDKIKEYEARNEEIITILKGYSKKLNELKTFCDYVAYKLEKTKKYALMQKTGQTFALECYVEKKEAKEFMEDLEQKFDNILLSEEKITKTDEPPTKIVGSKITKQADFVVNMYSVPNYRDVDPTWSVFVFFMVFFGFIIADVGYGIVLCLFGFLLAHKKNLSSGSKRLWTLIGTAGVFAIIWGFLFGSFFGFTHELWSFIPQGVMPNPQKDAITLLLICLLMGIVQIAFGYLMRGINYFKHKQVMAGLVNGVAWVLFLLGMAMAVTKFLVEFFNLAPSPGFASFMTAIQMPGLIIMFVGLGFGVILAGIGTKGFTKFTKSFAALYGLINLFSDILSYARLFGLMLSGAIIGQQFNEIALSVMVSPVGYVFGFLIMLIGHSFNIAMGALGAYIHDTRLQYVEYFGKFYTGEGRLFAPFCVEQKHTIIKDFGEEIK